MTNVEYEIDHINDKPVLRITVKLDETHGPSKSGKTIVVASSRGNKRIEGTDCFFGLNIYKYPETEGE